jgi:hypothetical protein
VDSVSLSGVDNKENFNSLLNKANNKKVSFPDQSLSLNDSLPQHKYEDNNDTNECDQSFVSITTTSSIVDNKVMKRKIVR